MSTLGLSGPPTQEEALWKRLLWPEVRTAHDADLLGQQGFWIAEIIALLSAAFLVFTGHPLLAAVTFLFYVLGGFGLREGDVAAAALVFAAYLLDEFAAMRVGLGGFGIVRLVILAILLANLRGAILVNRWRKSPALQADDEPEPMRFNESWQDKFRDQLPRRLWPKLRIPFYIIAGLFVMLEALGVFSLWVLHLRT